MASVPSKSYRCAICKAEFQSLVECVGHMKTTHLPPNSIIRTAETTDTSSTTATLAASGDTQPEKPVAKVGPDSSAQGTEPVSTTSLLKEGTGDSGLKPFIPIPNQNTASMETVNVSVVNSSQSALTQKLPARSMPGENNLAVSLREDRTDILKSVSRLASESKPLVSLLSTPQPIQQSTFQSASQQNAQQIPLQSSFSGAQTKQTQGFVAGKVSQSAGSGLSVSAPKILQPESLLSASDQNSIAQPRTTFAKSSADAAASKQALVFGTAGRQTHKTIVLVPKTVSAASDSDSKSTSAAGLAFGRSEIGRIVKGGSENKTIVVVSKGNFSGPQAQPSLQSRAASATRGGVTVATKSGTASSKTGVESSKTGTHPTTEPNEDAPPPKAVQRPADHKPGPSILVHTSSFGTVNLETETPDLPEKVTWTQRANASQILQRARSIILERRAGGRDEKSVMAKEEEEENEQAQLDSEENISITEGGVKRIGFIMATKRLTDPGTMKQKTSPVKDVGGPTKSYTCPICSRGFRFASSLSIHKKRHSGKQPYQCKICQKKFWHPTNLRVHERTHSKVKPYRCPDCGHGFNQQNDLKIHSRIHSGETPLRCSVEGCYRTFRDPSSFRRHVNRHAGIKPHLKCDQCEMRFYHMSALERHYTKHTGKKDFICDVCSAAFARADTLRLHQRQHNGEKPYLCSICNTRFADRSYCRRHLRKHKQLVGVVVKQERTVPSFTDDEENNDTDDHAEVLNAEHLEEVKPSKSPTAMKMRKVLIPDPNHVPDGVTPAPTIEIEIPDADFQQEQEVVYQYGDFLITVTNTDPNMPPADAASQRSTKAPQMLSTQPATSLQISTSTPLSNKLLASGSQVKANQHANQTQIGTNQQQSRTSSQSASERQYRSLSTQPPSSSPLSKIEPGQKEHVYSQQKKPDGNQPAWELWNSGSAVIAAATTQPLSEFNEIVSAVAGGDLVMVETKPDVSAMASVSSMYITKGRKPRTGEKRWPCDSCEAAFFHQAELRRHRTKHTGELPYQCPHCSRRVRDPSNLKRHLRTHTGERPYQCSVCEKRFIQLGHLTAHARIHSGQRPYKCTYCPATFIEANHLRYHLDKHRGHKPYLCSVCNRAFIRKAELRRHMNTHDRGLERPHKCPHCQVSYYRKDALRGHMTTHHPAAFMKLPAEISGVNVVLDEDSSLSKPDGIFHCPECRDTFFNKRSLHDHMTKLGHNLEEGELPQWKVKALAGFYAASESTEISEIKTASSGFEIITTASSSSCSQSGKDKTSDPKPDNLAANALCELATGRRSESSRNEGQGQTESLRQGEVGTKSGENSAVNVNSSSASVAEKGSTLKMSTPKVSSPAVLASQQSVVKTESVPISLPSGAVRKIIIGVPTSVVSAPRSTSTLATAKPISTLTTPKYISTLTTTPRSISTLVTPRSTSTLATPKYISTLTTTPKSVSTLTTPKPIPFVHSSIKPTSSAKSSASPQTPKIQVSASIPITNSSPFPMPIARPITVTVSVHTPRIQVFTQAGASSASTKTVPAHPGKALVLSSAVSATSAVTRATASSMAATQATISVSTKPTMNVSKPAVDVSKTVISVSKPTVDVSKPTINVSKPAISVSKPVISVTMPTISVTQPAVGVLSGAPKTALDGSRLDSNRTISKTSGGSVVVSAHSVLLSSGVASTTATAVATAAVLNTASVATASATASATAVSNAASASATAVLNTTAATTTAVSNTASTASKTLPTSSVAVVAESDTSTAESKAPTKYIKIGMTPKGIPIYSPLDYLMKDGKYVVAKSPTTNLVTVGCSKGKGMLATSVGSKQGLKGAKETPVVDVAAKRRAGLVPIAPKETARTMVVANSSAAKTRRGAKSVVVKAPTTSSSSVGSEIPSVAHSSSLPSCISTDKQVPNSVETPQNTESSFGMTLRTKNAKGQRKAAKNADDTTTKTPASRNGQGKRKRGRPPKSPSVKNEPGVVQKKEMRQRKSARKVAEKARTVSEQPAVPLSLSRLGTRRAVASSSDENFVKQVMVAGVSAAVPVEMEVEGADAELCTESGLNLQVYSDSDSGLSVVNLDKPTTRASTRKTDRRSKVVERSAVTVSVKSEPMSPAKSDAALPPPPSFSPSSVTRPKRTMRKRKADDDEERSDMDVKQTVLALVRDESKLRSMKSAIPDSVVPTGSVLLAVNKMVGDDDSVVGGAVVKSGKGKTVEVEKKVIGGPIVKSGKGKTVEVEKKVIGGPIVKSGNCKKVVEKKVVGGAVARKSIDRKKVVGAIGGDSDGEGGVGGQSVGVGCAKSTSVEGGPSPPLLSPSTRSGRLRKTKVIYDA